MPERGYDPGMSTPADQPGTDPQPADAEAAPEDQLESSTREESDQDSEPPLSAPDGPDGTVDSAGLGAEDEQNALPDGAHGTARRPPADS